MDLTQVIPTYTKLYQLIPCYTKLCSLLLHNIFKNNASMTNMFKCISPDIDVPFDDDDNDISDDAEVVDDDVFKTNY